MPTFDLSFMRVDCDEDPTIVEGFYRTVDWPVLPREGEGLDIGAGLDPVTLATRVDPQLGSTIIQVRDPRVPVDIVTMAHKDARRECDANAATRRLHANAWPSLVYDFVKEWQNERQGRRLAWKPIFASFSKR